MRQGDRSQNKATQANNEGDKMTAHFNTTEYEVAHGKKPRGTMVWWFVPADYCWGENMPDGAVESIWGGYSDAKHEVARKYPQISVWKVLS
jgi:hypothetical protein